MRDAELEAAVELLQNVRRLMTKRDRIIDAERMVIAAAKKIPLMTGIEREYGGEADDELAVALKMLEDAEAL